MFKLWYVFFPRFQPMSLSLSLSLSLSNAVVGWTHIAPIQSFSNTLCPLPASQHPQSYFGQVPCDCVPLSYPLSAVLVAPRTAVCVAIRMTTCGKHVRNRIVVYSFKMELRGSCPIRWYTSSLVTWSLHLRPKVRLKHLLWNASRRFSCCTVLFEASAPYSNVDTTADW